jgi:hypothetical protein
MPTSTLYVPFAQQYESLEAETARIMLITTVDMAFVLPASIVLSAHL